jgi:hypothetical protein
MRSNVNLKPSIRFQRPMGHLLENRVPNHDTFGRIFAKLDTGKFLSAMHGWADEFAESLRNKGVAIDGKMLRGSFGKLAAYTITAFATETRTVLSQMFVGAKSNEIPAVPLLLQLLDLDGAIATLDAMHCQTETAQAIIDAEADYILSVKANQPKLYGHLLGNFVEQSRALLCGSGRFWRRKLGVNKARNMVATCGRWNWIRSLRASRISSQICWRWTRRQPGSNSSGPTKPDW